MRIGLETTSSPKVWWHVLFNRVVQEPIGILSLNASLIVSTLLGSEEVPTLVVHAILSFGSNTDEECSDIIIGYKILHFRITSRA